MDETRVKKAEYAGLFYSSDPVEFKNLVDVDLAKAAMLGPDFSEIFLPAMIVPSGGYSYCSLTTLSAYQKLQARKYQKVIVLGSSHFFSFNGIALPDFDYFETPLGQIPIDQLSVERLKTNFNFHVYQNAFAKEYSVEMQLPYLQYFLKEFELVPLIVGNKINLMETVKMLQSILDEKTLIVVSTNFSHFHNEELARKTDQTTINAIQAKDPVVIMREGQASTLRAITILNELAIANHWLPVFTGYSTSADGGDDPDSVVGYAGLVYLQE